MNVAIASICFAVIFVMVLLLLAFAYPVAGKIAACYVGIVVALLALIRWGRKKFGPM